MERLEGKKTIKIRLLGGKFAQVPVETIVGYCHFADHKGYITEEMLSQRKCIEKNCGFLERDYTYPFWKSYWTNNGAAEKLSKEQKKKQKKIEKINREEDAKQIKEEAIMWAERLQYPIKITSVIANDSTHMTVYYVSSLKYNDSHLYLGLVTKLHKKFIYRIRIEKTRRSDGRYMLL